MPSTLNIFQALRKIQELPEPRASVAIFHAEERWYCSIQFGAEAEAPQIVAGEAIGSGESIELAIIYAAIELG